MALITWTKEQFGTSVAAHDDEHKTLFDMLNALHEAAPAGNRVAIGQQLDALIAFVAKHFAAEEANMTKTGYPAYPAHKAEHDKLVATCLDLQKKFHANEVKITQETTAFVRDWLNAHIPTFDKGYGPHLNGKGIA